MDKIIKILIISSDAKLREILHFCFDGWGYEVLLWDNYSEDITPIKKISPDVIVIDVHSARPGDLKICTHLRNDFLTTSIPIITLINKRHLRTHLLNLKYGVDDYLIKPPDPLDMRVRIEMAVRRLQLSFHANPLSGLPGANVLEEIVKERLRKKTEFTIGYVDIDNFKCFNDAHGYRRGDGVILHTAYMLYGALQRFGNNDDFIAHIGGDDFAFVTTPDKYEAVCQNFIFLFDRITPFHYSQDDRKRRYIIAKDRTDVVRKISLVSLSVAIVNVKRDSNINNILQLNEQIVEIKSYLKKIPGSKYMADRRQFADDKGFGPQIHKHDYRTDFYRPLGQILLENKSITTEQLEDALKIHWRRGVILGEVLKELHLTADEHIQEALRIQKELVNKV